MIFHEPEPSCLRVPSDIGIPIGEDQGTAARCHTIYNCTISCPRDIQITKAIGELKMATITGKVE